MQAGQLRWRCRRGMKELDLMLLGWLERHYDTATSAEQAVFRAFLELPDPLIAAYLLGREVPPETEYRQLITSIVPAAPR